MEKHFGNAHNFGARLCEARKEQVKIPDDDFNACQTCRIETVQLERIVRDVSMFWQQLDTFKKEITTDVTKQLLETIMLRTNSLASENCSRELEFALGNTLKECEKENQNKLGEPFVENLKSDADRINTMCKVFAKLDVVNETRCNACEQDTDQTRMKLDTACDEAGRILGEKECKHASADCDFENRFSAKMTVLAEAVQDLEKHVENTMNEIGQLKMELESESRCRIHGHNEVASAHAILHGPCGAEVTRMTHDTTKALQSITETLNTEAPERATNASQLSEKIEAETRDRTKASSIPQACIASFNAKLGHEIGQCEHEDGCSRALQTNIQQELTAEEEAPSAYHDADQLSENTDLAQSAQQLEKHAALQRMLVHVLLRSRSP